MDRLGPDFGQSISNDEAETEVVKGKRRPSGKVISALAVGVLLLGAVAGNALYSRADLTVKIAFSNTLASDTLGYKIFVRVTPEGLSSLGATDAAVMGLGISGVKTMKEATEAINLMSFRVASKGSKLTDLKFAVNLSYGDKDLASMMMVDRMFYLRSDLDGASSVKPVIITAESLASLRENINSNSFDARTPSLMNGFLDGNWFGISMRPGTSLGDNWDLVLETVKNGDVSEVDINQMWSKFARSVKVKSLGSDEFGKKYLLSLDVKSALNTNPSGMLSSGGSMQEAYLAEMKKLVEVLRTTIWINEGKISRIEFDAADFNFNNSGSKIKRGALVLVVTLDTVSSILTPNKFTAISEQDQSDLFDSALGLYSGDSLDIELEFAAEVFYRDSLAIYAFDNFGRRGPDLASLEAAAQDLESGFSWSAKDFSFRSSTSSKVLYVCLDGVSQKRCK